MPDLVARRPFFGVWGETLSTRSDNFVFLWKPTLLRVRVPGVVPGVFFLPMATFLTDRISGGTVVSAQIVCVFPTMCEKY